MCHIHCCPGRWASALEPTQIAHLLSLHTKCDNFLEHESSQSPTGEECLPSTVETRGVEMRVRETHVMAASKSSSSGASTSLECFVGVIHPCLSHLSSYRFVRRLNIKCDNAHGNFFVLCKVLGPSFHLQARRASPSPSAQVNLYLGCRSHPFSFIWQNLHHQGPFPLLFNCLPFTAKLPSVR